MASKGIENIASGLNSDGSKQFTGKNLSHVVSKIGQGRKNLITITENIVVGFAWFKLFSPEHKINLSFVKDNPDIDNAIALAYPNVDISSVSYNNEQELLGFVNGVKGKLFEIKVADKLNSRERVGDIELEDGQYVSLAESPTQEGYDLMLHNDDGSIEDFYQLKATDSIDYVKHAITENADIEIITTSEVAEELDNMEVHDSEISNDLDFLGDVPILGSILAIGAFTKGGVSGGVNYLINRGVATTGGTLAASLAALIGFGGILLPIAGITGAIFTSKIFRNNIKISLEDDTDLSKEDKS